MDSSWDSNILDRKESVYDNENKPAVSIMDFITIIYNCNWILYHHSKHSFKYNKTIREYTICVY